MRTLILFTGFFVLGLSMACGDDGRATCDPECGPDERCVGGVCLSGPMDGGPRDAGCPEGDLVVDGVCVPVVDSGDAGDFDGGEAGDSAPDAPDASDGSDGGCTPACGAPTPFCDAATGACVGCRTEADCGGDTPYCVATGVDERTCAACRDATDCDASAPACASNTCAGCAGDDSLCARFATAPLCGSNGECVACNDASDCTDLPRGRCDPTTRTCVP